MLLAKSPLKEAKCHSYDAKNVCNPVIEPDRGCDVGYDIDYCCLSSCFNNSPISEVKRDDKRCTANKRLYNLANLLAPYDSNSVVTYSLFLFSAALPFCHLPLGCMRIENYGKDGLEAFIKISQLESYIQSAPADTGRGTNSDIRL